MRRQGPIINGGEDESFEGSGSSAPCSPTKSQVFSPKHVPNESSAIEPVVSTAVEEQVPTVEAPINAAADAAPDPGLSATGAARSTAVGT